MSENPNTDFISNAEEEIAKRIRARSQFFSNVTILTCAAGDTNKKIQEAVTSLGLFVVVEIKPSGKLPVVGDSTTLPIWITITESPTTNRGTGKYATGKTMRMALEELARLIDDNLGVGEATMEPGDDPNRETVRVVGKVILTIQERNQEQ